MGVAGHGRHGTARAAETAQAQAGAGGGGVQGLAGPCQACPHLDGRGGGVVDGDGAAQGARPPAVHMHMSACVPVRVCVQRCGGQGGGVPLRSPAHCPCPHIAAAQGHTARACCHGAHSPAVAARLSHGQGPCGVHLVTIEHGHPAPWVHSRRSSRRVGAMGPQPCRSKRPPESSASPARGDAAPGAVLPCQHTHASPLARRNILTCCWCCWPGRQTCAGSRWSAGAQQ